jgi:hypothetical protein
VLLLLLLLPPAGLLRYFSKRPNAHTDAHAAHGCPTESSAEWCGSGVEAPCTERRLILGIASKPTSHG